MERAKELFIKSVRGAVLGESASFGEFSEWKEFFTLVARQNAWSFINFALENSDAPQEIKDFVAKRFIGVVKQQVGQEFYEGEAFDKFEERGIPYLPIKGSSMRKLYPHKEMRVSCDVDILVRKEDMSRVREVMRDCGLTLEAEADGEDHDVWKADPGVTIEPHKSLMGITDFVGYFTDFWDKTLPIDGAYRRRLSCEDEYIFTIAHIYKHFCLGGCGVKSITDVWLYERANPNMDREYISRELEKIGLKKFESVFSRLSKAWMGETCFDDDLTALAEFLFDGGVYGTGKTAMTMTVGKGDVGTHKAKIKYLAYRMFPPYKILKIRYPSLEKFPFLLPVYWVVRIFDALFSRRDTVKRNLDNCNGVSAEDIEKAKNVYRIIND